MNEKLLTDAELAAIAERVEKATPGPWESRNIRVPCVHRTEAPRDEWYRVATIGGPVYDGRGHRSRSREQDEANMDFIASVRADVPRLLSDLQRYRAWHRRLVEYVDQNPPVDYPLLRIAEEVRAALEESS